MVITEPLNAVATRQSSLSFSGFRHAEIIEAEIGGDVGLVMPVEHRFGLGHICPLGEALPPPFVVLWYRVELGQVQCNSARAFHLRAKLGGGSDAPITLSWVKSKNASPF